MKFKINKGTETFQKLSDIKKRMEACNDTASLFVNTIPGAKDEFTIADDCVAGGVSGIEFKEKPDGWRLAFPGQSQRLFFPKAEKRNKKLLAAISELPKIRREEVNVIVGFEPHFAGITFFKSVGVHWGKKFILLKTGDGANYKPPKDVGEILESEYNKLSKQLERNQERKK